VVKLLVGILKGAVIGAALGYGAYAINFDSAVPWLTYALIGAVVGLFVGKPIWSLIRDERSTTWIAVLKSVVGFGIGVGLYALIAKAWDPAPQLVNGFDIFRWGPTLGGAIGAIYGGFVELDDAIGDPPASAAKKEPQKKLPAKKA
jgi:hypothetical protein